MNPIRLLGSYEASKMRQAGKAAAELLNLLGELIQPGITTQHLDDAAVKWATQRNYRHGPLGYMGNGSRPFPRSICTSIGSVICHGIPSVADVLKDGDIINIDVTPVIDGWFGDTSRTFAVGQISDEAARLIRVTEECLAIGIAAVKPGGTIGDIGAAIQKHAETNKLGVVRAYCGHGVERIFHTAPAVPHFGVPGTGVRLEPGMCFTIEPMLTLGGTQAVTDGTDEWTVRTTDGSLSAQAEHTVVVGKTSAEVLTLPN